MDMMVKERPRRVCFYGRVSTEHEAQTNALENQMEWYNELLKRHENWTLTGSYIDKGITGTLAKKRTHFLKMIKDAENGDFDLIVTREVCRFARNTVDTLAYTRQLKKYGVEVYFVNDNIWTFDNDGELRLSIMAALAQEESRKVSERVLAGQEISRKKGVLYGNGNILGYRLVRNINEDGKWNPEENTYKIEPEQAETVQMIYDMCCDGMGYLQISKELERRKRKDGAGNVSWCSSKIGRILHNKTYAGYKGYRKSYTTDYLDHDRAQNLDRESYQYVKGNWEPIISEEQWNRVQKICAEKTKTVGDHTMGKKPTDNVWLNKLRCSCAAHSKYRKNKWRTNKNTGETVFGYQCYSQLNKGSYKFRKENGLPTEGYCNISMIGEWKLELMAKILLQMLWTDRTGAIQEAVDMIRECYTEDNQTDNRKEQLAVQSQVDKYTKRLGNLLELRVDGEISKDEYQRMKAETEEKIATYKMQLLQFDQETDILPDIESQISQMEETLKQYIDFSDKNVPREILEKLLVQVIPCQNHRFVWVFNLLDRENEMLCSMDGRKNAPIFSWFEESPTLFSTQHRLLLLISKESRKDDLRGYYAGNKLGYMRI